MSRRLALATTAVLVGVVPSLAACSGGSDPAGGSTASSASSPSAATGSDTRTTAQAAGEDGVALNPAAEYAPFPDPPRRLTLLEQALMRAPGPYAGDAFDLDAAVAAVRATTSQTADEWREAILTQTHGDYAKDAQELINFAPAIDTVATPAATMQGVTVVGQNHFSIVLDASGSMAAKNGSTTRMAQAKAAIRSFAAELPTGSTVSLRVYGDRGSNSTADKKVSCTSSTVVYQGAPAGIAAKLDAVKPVGWTPLAAAITASAGDIPADASDAIVYVVTDGIETCGGNPVAAAKALAGQGIKPIVNVIGFQVGNSEAAELKKIATAGGGTYTTAKDGAALSEYWREDAQAMMTAWQTWQTEALDAIEKQGEANMAVAQSTGQRIMDGINQEFSNQELLLDVLAKSEPLDDKTRTEVWAQLYHRELAIWKWAHEQQTTNWRTAYHQKLDNWRAAYHLSIGKWSDYYRKSTGR